ncbi:hypothetical protein C4D60_Mb10t07840 [Musa balbisiana]|uniref:Uncharacterized protein n=1 Tax=Musa balbisiana TaxID=52838 RepID=A0A4S8IVE8_MUSBA|nr:hypothetical protein C4D60_Mb10t07840 [Musa balbisiana]
MANGIRGQRRILDHVDLLDRRSCAAGAGSGAALGTTLVHASFTTLVHLSDDGVAEALELLHLVLELIGFRQLVVVQPLDRLIDRVLYLLLVTRRKLGADLVVPDGVPHVVGVVLQGVLRFHLFLVLLVLRLPPLVVGDGDLVLVPGGLVLRRHVQDPIGVDIEADVDLRHAAGGGRDAGELEFAEQVVVPGPRPLALVDLDQDSRLVVGVGREDLLFLGGDGRVPRNQDGHHAASGLQPEGERSDVQQQQILHLLVALSAQDRGLHRRTAGDSLVGVDALAKLLPIEEVLQQLLHLGNPGRTPDEDDVMDAALVHLGVPQALLHWLHALPEQVHVELLEPRARDAGVEVDPLV